MVKHVVMFKMKIFASEEVLKRNVSLIFDELNSLPELINEIKSFEVGINESESARAYDLVLVSEFNDYASLKLYQDHPEHLKVVSLIKELTENTIVVDYKMN